MNVFVMGERGVLYYTVVLRKLFLIPFPKKEFPKNLYLCTAFDILHRQYFLFVTITQESCKFYEFWEFTCCKTFLFTSFFFGKPNVDAFICHDK